MPTRLVPPPLRPPTAAPAGVNVSRRPLVPPPPPPPKRPKVLPK